MSGKETVGFSGWGRKSVEEESVRPGGPGRVQSAGRIRVQRKGLSQGRGERYRKAKGERDGELRKGWCRSIRTGCVRRKVGLCVRALVDAEGAGEFLGGRGVKDRRGRRIVWKSGQEKKG
jgi:hypothetical protein